MISFPSQREDHNHHASIRSLFKSAEGGCPLCTLICEFFPFLDQERLLPCYPERHTDSVSLRYRSVRTSKSVTSAIRWVFMFSTFDSLRNGDGVNTYVGAIDVHEVHDETYSSSSAPSYSTYDQDVWKMAFGWIDNCVQNHSKCNKKTRDNWLPTRLLDLGSPSNPQLRIHITTQDSPQVPYLTLSHCWGEQQIIQLTTTNVSQMREEIVFSELPKTFQDAIRFTRAYGARFLWIDSLCILQDSFSDWQLESARMGDIYKNALCNIAATAASDGRVGCFFNRNPLLVQNFRLHVNSFRGLSSTTGLCDFVDGDFWDNNVDHAPLNRRAWVLQEQFLSPRILHCGKNQLLWECHEIAACETYPNGAPFDRINAYSGFNLKRFDLNLNRNFEANSPIVSNALTRWWQLVSKYTRRSLTKEMDKLVAISAVAKQFQPVIGEEYLAGLWRHSLPLQLLWKVYLRPYSKEPCRTETYCAPSWSWASFKASHVQLGYNHHSIVETFGEKYMIRILECNVQPVSEDIYGQLSGGSLTVKGWLRSLRCFGSLSTAATTRIVRLQSHKVGYIDLDVSYDYRNDELYYMPVIEKRHGYKPGTMVVGLVLINTGAEGEYQRVGIFNNNTGEEKATELCFLFKPPTYPRSESDMSAKIEIETQFERLAMTTKYSGSNSNGSSTLLDIANINLFDNTEISSRSWGKGELMVESTRCDIDGRTSFDSTDEADETAPNPLGNEELLNREGQSQREKVLSSKIQSEDHGMMNDTWNHFEDEEAWIEGVFKII